eukprot:TRINITY_DN27806_c0_g1_i1.p1 TRINITY_DN27806_c0_g1~~TRINITY_DN27806_c0_g1_i1.p1  ORF type:complete len:441 (+),score=143.84 TRINITY_DN27806_c0_g1_i1:48-1325(+)
MPTKKFIDPKKSSTYKVVYKSVEDPTYEDEGTAVTLKHIDKSQNRRAKGFEKDIIKEEMYTYDMQNPDDTVEQGIFEDEIEADFDQDFIREMMMPGEEEEEEESIDDYPKHEGNRDVDMEYEALLKHDYQKYDMEIEDEDPRADGPLPVEAYVPAFQEFAAGEREGHFVEGRTERYRETGHFIQRLDANGEEVFHESEAGKFYTVLVSKKDIDIVEDYHAGGDAAREICRQRLAVAEEKLLQSGEVEEKVDLEVIKVKKVEDKWDCQTVLTTMSTLENHPTVIAAEKGKIKINKKTGALIPQKKLTTKALDALGKIDTIGELEKMADYAGPVDNHSSEEGDAKSEDDVDAASVGESFITVVDTTVKRNKKETAEEKRERKALVKAGKREMRAAKKDLKTAYKAVGIKERVLDPTAKQQRAQLSLR